MKQWLCNLRMTKKLLVSPFTAMLFLVIFGLVSYAGFIKQKTALDDIYKNRFQYYKASAAMSGELWEVHASVYKLMGWIASGYDQQKIDTYRNQQIERITKVRASVQDLLKKPGLGKTEREYFQAASDYMAKYADLAQTAMTMDAVTGAILMSQTEDCFQEMSQKLNQLVKYEDKLGSEEYAFAGSIFVMAVVVSSIVFFAAVVLSFGVSFLMKSLILSPIKRTVEVIEGVAQGDLTRRIDVVSRDEIGEMAMHFNAFVDKLHDSIKQVAESSDKVSTAARTLDNATEQMAAGVEQAAMQVNAVAAASEEMSKTSSEIALNCVAAVKSSENASASAHTGETTIEDTIQGMNRISGRVKESSDIIENLGIRSDQIGEIVGLINDVADQTNLLALNAAIEAARAGEHGRGFAVVADEVRKLAERTSSATQEIGDTIRAMQTETKKAVASMAESVGDVSNGTNEAAKSGEALRTILEQITKVTAEINQIAVASEEETATTNEIAANIQQISQVMQETARSIQENANASSQLAGLSNELQTMVKQFKL